MGEAGFGTITKRLGNDSWMNYRVRQFNYGAEGDMFTRDVDALDVARLATEEDAMEYYRVRNGQ